MAMHSKFIRGNLVFYDGPTWVDAIGPNVIKFAEHFVQTPFASANNIAYATTTIVQAGSSNTTLVLNPGADGGTLLITTDNADNDGANIQVQGEAFKLANGYPLYFGCRFKISETTQSDFFLGLAITDTDVLGGVTDGVFFDKTDGTTPVKFHLEKGSSITDSGTIATCDTSFHTYEFYFDGTNVDAWYDGALQTRLATTNLPNTEWITPTIHVLTGSAASITAEVDWLRVIQLLA